jgi:rSAM/selenodomain-associated transferase 1
MDNALIIFVKNPVHGKVKTRLAAAIGNDKALDIYLHLITHTLKAAANAAADKYIYFSDEIDNTVGQKTTAFKRSVQSGIDLGEKMKNAFSDILNNSYRKVIIIGTDCPGISPEILQRAFNQLADTDVVIGPAADGGYYLLGMKALQPLLFDNMEWSTSTVLQTTVERCTQNKLRYQLLEELNDIDEEKDLVHFYKLMKRDNNDQHNNTDTE